MKRLIELCKKLLDARFMEQVDEIRAEIGDLLQEENYKPARVKVLAGTKFSDFDTTEDPEEAKECLEGIETYEFDTGFEANKFTEGLEEGSGYMEASTVSEEDFERLKKVAKEMRR